MPRWPAVERWPDRYPWTPSDHYQTRLLPWRQFIFSLSIDAILLASIRLQSSSSSNLFVSWKKTCDLLIQGCGLSAQSWMAQLIISIEMSFLKEKACLAVYSWFIWKACFGWLSSWMGTYPWLKGWLLFWSWVGCYNLNWIMNSEDKAENLNSTDFFLADRFLHLLLDHTL